jgi:CheY-like chemotaxis protein
VQRLVEMHRGRVEVFSVLGQGSEFVVRLPVELAVAPQIPEARVEIATPLTRALRVLVVDDSVDTADSLALLVKALGHEVRTAYDGPSALPAAVDFLPDVAVLDLGLPELNGYEVAERIRQQPWAGGLVLIAMTGYGQESDRQRSRMAGFDHHLVKPADFGEVQRILISVAEKMETPQA